MVRQLTFHIGAGITIPNEAGVDPGVDHLYAVKVIGEVYEKGGQVLKFASSPGSTLPFMDIC
jgi:hypothetical protein